MSRGSAQSENTLKAPELKVFGASLNNLKNISCTLPHEKIVVISGPSGAGKSSLIFQTIYQKLKFGVNGWGVLSSSFENSTFNSTQISGYRYSLGVPDSSNLDSKLTLREFFGLEKEIDELFQKYSAKFCPSCSRELKEEGFADTLGAAGTLEGEYDLVLKCSRQNISKDWFLKNGLLRFIDEGEVYLAEEFVLDGSLYVYPIVDRFKLPAFKDDLLKALSNFSNSNFSKIELYSLRGNKTVCCFYLPGICQSCGQDVGRENLDSSKLFNLNYEDLGNVSFDFLAREIKNLNIGSSEFSILLNKFKFLGLSHLKLGSELSSLSSGELVRARVLKNSSRNPCGAAFFLEHSFARLHPKDKLVLWKYLTSLNKSRNSIFLIEQCSEIKKAADFLLELGPSSGKGGGQVVLEKAQNGDQYVPISLPKTKELESKENFLSFSGLKKKNLKSIDIAFPLNQLTVLTGVSGSGKTTVLKEILAPFLKAYLKSKASKIDFSKFFLNTVQGAENLSSSVFIDTLLPLLKPSSSVCTALSILPEIKNYYLKTETAKIKGLSSKDFSFHNSLASCKGCNGLGFLKNNFLGFEECQVCQGLRYNESLDDITWRGLSIKDLLQFSLEEAFDFFKFNPKISKVLKSSLRLNLGHLKLSQASFSLSSGEKSRLLLSKELLRGMSPRNPKIFLLDEPAAGLSDKEVSSLIGYLKEICSFGHTVFLIEHNTAFLKEADFLIEMGPGAGEMGGEIVRCGTLNESSQLS